MLIGIAAILFLVLCSAFFSASETGLTAASRARIYHLKTEGSRRAGLVERLRDQNERLISTILLGNNAVNIGASTLATALAINYFGESDEVLFYVTVAMTFLVLIFGEVLPKTYALHNAEKVALRVAPVFSLLMKLFKPVTFLVDKTALFFLWALGSRGNAGAVRETPGTEALRGSIGLHHDRGAVMKSDRDMLDSILDLADREVGEIMTHRKDMVTLDADLPPERIVAHMLDNEYTRIPMWRERPDNIIGILHAKDLVRALYRDGRGGPIDIIALLQEPWFIPGTTTLKDQLHAFREKHAHVALVVDEYGDLLGMITLEDILEEIVGQIEDEHDANIQRIKKQTDGSYIVYGDVTVRDLNRELDWNLPDDRAATVAGLVMHEAQAIPDVGQVFHFHGCRFEIRKKQRHQITRIRISRFDEDGETEGYDQ